MHKAISQNTHIANLNKAAKTISWFLHGMRFRLAGCEQYRV